MNPAAALPVAPQDSLLQVQLHRRAALLQAVRAFMQHRRILEVDTPILGDARPYELQIQPLSTRPCGIEGAGFGAGCTVRRRLR